MFCYVLIIKDKPFNKNRGCNKNMSHKLYLSVSQIRSRSYYRLPLCKLIKIMVNLLPSTTLTQ